MDTRRSSTGSVSIFSSFIFMVCISLCLTACRGGNSPYLSPAPLLSPNAIPQQSTSPPTSPLSFEPTPTPTCTANLTFISDLTIPDGTLVAPGSTMDKQWLVQNSGNCNWDTHYRLHLISGDALGASTEQALYPARAGTQATLRILFTAPQEAGDYVSEWQAFDPDGNSFGVSFFIKIEVQQ